MDKHDTYQPEKGTHYLSKKIIYISCSFGFSAIAIIIMPKLISKGASHLYKQQNINNKNTYSDEDPVIVKKSDLNKSE